MSTDGGLGLLFPKHLPDLDWQRIETGGVGCGIPDLNGCGEEIEFWIENKGVRTPITPEQVGWISKRRRHGGRVFIAIRVQRPSGPRRGPATDSLYLYSGDDVKALVTAKSSVTPLLVGHGGPARWPWPQIRQTILFYSFPPYAKDLHHEQPRPIDLLHGS